MFIIDREVNSLKIAKKFEKRGWGLLSMLDQNQYKGLEQCYQKLQEDKELFQEAQEFLEQIMEYYGKEVFKMYTVENWYEDHPPGKLPKFVFPWEAEYHQQELDKAKKETEEAKAKAEKEAREAEKQYQINLLQTEVANLETQIANYE